MYSALRLEPVQAASSDEKLLKAPAAVRSAASISAESSPGVVIPAARSSARGGVRATSILSTEPTLGSVAFLQSLTLLLALKVGMGARPRARRNKRRACAVALGGAGVHTLVSVMP